MSNTRPERNHSRALADEDWDAEIEEANAKPRLMNFIDVFSLNLVGF